MDTRLRTGWVDTIHGHQDQVGWWTPAMDTRLRWAGRTPVMGARLRWAGGHQSWMAGSGGLGNTSHGCRKLLLWRQHLIWDVVVDTVCGSWWALAGLAPEMSPRRSSLPPGTAGDAQLGVRAETSGRITLGRCLLTAGHGKSVLGTPCRGPALPP